MGDLEYNNGHDDGLEKRLKHVQLMFFLNINVN